MPIENGDYAKINVFAMVQCSISLKCDECGEKLIIGKRMFDTATEWDADDPETWSMYVPVHLESAVENPGELLKDLYKTGHWEATKKAIGLGWATQETHDGDIICPACRKKEAVVAG